MIYLLVQGRSLNALAMGSESATSLGCRRARLRRNLFVVTSLMVGVAVAVSGVIGFVGLVVPHIVRLIVGSDHRRVLPVGVLFGAAFMVVGDLLARTIVAPQEMPIGVITAFHRRTDPRSCSSAAGPISTGRPSEPRTRRPLGRHRRDGGSSTTWTSRSPSGGFVGSARSQRKRQVDHPEGHLPGPPPVAGQVLLDGGDLLQMRPGAPHDAWRSSPRSRPSSSTSPSSNGDDRADAPQAGLRPGQQGGPGGVVRGHRASRL